MQIITFSTYKAKPNLQVKANKKVCIISKLLLFISFFFFDNSTPFSIAAPDLRKFYPKDLNLLYNLIHFPKILFPLLSLLMLAIASVITVNKHCPIIESQSHLQVMDGGQRKFLMDINIFNFLPINDASPGTRWLLSAHTTAVKNIYVNINSGHTVILSLIHT